MNCFDIPLRIPKGCDSAEVAVVCCLHFGHKSCDRKKAYQWRDWILGAKNRFAYSLGDDIENAVPGDEVHNSMMWDSDKHPEDQYREAADFWRPVADSGKLLMTHNSNHFWRTQAKTGINVPRDLNVFLQGHEPNERTTDPRPDRFPRWGDWQAISKLQVGRQTYLVHSWHGSGGGCTPESALRKCRSMAEMHDADVYLMGHFHNRIFWQDNKMEFSANGMRARERQRTFAVTGGFLGWHDSYAERAGLRPNRRGAIVLRLGAREWDVKVTM